MRKFRIGDKVVGDFGYGTVVNIVEDTDRPVRVDVGDGYLEWYCLDGRSSEDKLLPTLFHVDEKPKQWVIKRKVKITQWANVYKGRMPMYPTKEEARMCARPEAIAVAVKLTGEYIVVE